VLPPQENTRDYKKAYVKGKKVGLKERIESQLHLYKGFTILIIFLKNGFTLPFIPF